MMPNWCSVEEIIVGPEEEVQNIHDKMIEWTKKSFIKTDFGDQWIGNIVIGAGFNYEELDCRGSVFDIDLAVMDDVDCKTAFFGFNSEVAWGAIPDTWHAILEKHAPNCKYYYRAIETGMCEFYTNDKNKDFFKEDYFISSCIADDDSLPDSIKSIEDDFDLIDGESYWEKDDLVNILQKILNTTETDIDKLIEHFEEIDLGHEDNYINIYKIERI